MLGRLGKQVLTKAHDGESQHDQQQGQQHSCAGLEVWYQLKQPGSGFWRSLVSEADEAQERDNQQEPKAAQDWADDNKCLQ